MTSGGQKSSGALQKRANSYDALLGARLSLLRRMRGLSRVDLGAALGVTFQQIQKYERGANRISARRLYEIAVVLDIEIQHFFDQLAPVAPAAEGVSKGVPDAPADVLALFARIKDKKTRQFVLELMTALADGTD